jgi:hypothetical protein
MKHILFALFLSIVCASAQTNSACAIAVSTGKTRGDCIPYYYGYANYKPANTNHWGFYSATNRMMAIGGTTNDSIQFIGLYGDSGCSNGVVTFTNYSPQYQFALYFGTTNFSTRKANCITIVGLTNGP